MRLILADIISLSQHLEAIHNTPEQYKPNACPHCTYSNIWNHGSYTRKADRLKEVGGKLIPILRFRCPSCNTTFSVLPECIPPRRWYLWVIQQTVLWCKFLGWSYDLLNEHFYSPTKGTISRWFQRMNDCFPQHHQGICSVHSVMGYFSNLAPFWLAWFKQNSLSSAMWEMNRQSIPVP